MWYEYQETLNLHIQVQRRAAGRLNRTKVRALKARLRYRSNLLADLERVISNVFCLLFRPRFVEPSINIVPSRIISYKTS